MNRQIEMGIEIERQIDKQIVYRQINREREIGRNRKNTKTTKEGRKKLRQRDRRKWETPSKLIKYS